MPPRGNKEKTIRLTSSHLALTYPTCNVGLSDILNQLKFSLAKDSNKILNHIICHELHKDGTPHRHVYVQLHRAPQNVPPSMFWLESSDGTVHKGDFKDVRNVGNWTNYCIKDGDYITSYSKDDLAKVLIAKDRQKIDDAFLGAELMLKGRACIPDLLKCYPQLFFKLDKIEKCLDIYDSLGRVISKRDVLDNLWIMGPTGSGKSFMVHQQYPDHFKKEKSEFWCGYKYEEVVLFEDFDGSWPLESLKEWTDHYPFMARIKLKPGKKVRPTKCVFTSNYTIQEVVESYFKRIQMKCDMHLVRALERRFTVQYLDYAVPHVELDNYPPGYFYTEASGILPEEVEKHDPMAEFLEL